MWQFFSLFQEWNMENAILLSETINVIAAMYMQFEYRMPLSYMYCILPIGQRSLFSVSPMLQYKLKTRNFN